MTYQTKFLAVGSGIFFSVIMVGVGFWFLGDLKPVEKTALLLAGGAIVPCFLMSLVGLWVFSKLQKQRKHR